MSDVRVTRIGEPSSIIPNSLLRWTALVLFGQLCASSELRAAEDLIAVTTDLKESSCIEHYDVLLEPNLEHNRLDLQSTCTVRNQSDGILTRIDLDLLAAEQAYGAKVAVGRILADDGTHLVSCQFSHAPVKPLADADQAGTREFPRIIRVTLPSPMEPRTRRRLHLEYTITIPDLGADVSYGLIALPPEGGKQVNLLADYTWIPKVVSDSDARAAIYGRNFFPKGHRPTWRICLRHPDDMESLVLDGRPESIERIGNTSVSRYSSVAPGLPQVAIGAFERVLVEASGVSVIFLVPRGKYERRQVENAGRFFQHAYQFYSDLYGPLTGKPVHVAVGMAGHTASILRNIDTVGHGAFLGMFLSYLPAREAGAFDEIAAHELAHSWWGGSVSSYGRGTKFLCESFANFSAWHFARTIFDRDRFRGELALGVFQGTLAKPLFGPEQDSESAAYLKGPLVLDLLRQEMGESTFLAVMRCFASRFGNQHTSFPDLVAVCNEVSGRDWLPFFLHWCYGSGFPDYRLVSFSSMANTNSWLTRVSIRNAGKGLVTCPIALNTLESSHLERFAVAEGEARTFTWQTQGQVTNVVIDPDHSTLQGDAEEGRRKLAALPDAALSGNWPLYWKGVAHAEAGEYTRAEALLSRVIAMFKGQMSDIAPYAYHYSRGLVRVRVGHTAAGIDDLRLFLDGVLQPGKDQPASADAVIAKLTYARLLSAPTPEGRKLQLRELLEGVTGVRFEVDAGLNLWRAWWQENRTTFQPAQSAHRLSPAARGGKERTHDAAGESIAERTLR